MYVFYVWKYSKIFDLILYVGTYDIFKSLKRADEI